MLGKCLTPVQHNNDTYWTHQPDKDDTIKWASEVEEDDVSDRPLLSLERYSRRFGLCPEFISGTQRRCESDVCNGVEVGAVFLLILVLLRSAAGVKQ